MENMYVSTLLWSVFVWFSCILHGEYIKINVSHCLLINNIVVICLQNYLHGILLYVWYYSITNYGINVFIIVLCVPFTTAFDAFIMYSHLRCHTCIYISLIANLLLLQLDYVWVMKLLLRVDCVYIWFLLLLNSLRIFLYRCFRYDSFLLLGELQFISPAYIRKNNIIVYRIMQYFLSYLFLFHVNLSSLRSYLLACHLQDSYQNSSLCNYHAFLSAFSSFLWISLGYRCHLCI